MLKNCCCFSLKTGCLTCGVLNLIISLTFIGVMSYGLSVIESDKAHRWIYMMYLVIAAVNVIVSCVLIYGATREQKWLLLPWLIFDSVALAMSSIIAPYYCYTNWKNILFFIPLSVFWFFWFVVFSHFREIIKWEEEKPGDMYI